MSVTLPASITIKGYNKAEVAPVLDHKLAGRFDTASHRPVGDGLTVGSPPGAAVTRHLDRPIEAT